MRFIKYYVDFPLSLSLPLYFLRARQKFNNSYLGVRKIVHCACKTSLQIKQKDGSGKWEDLIFKYDWIYSGCLSRWHVWDLINIVSSQESKSYVRMKLKWQSQKRTSFYVLTKCINFLPLQLQCPVWQKVIYLFQAFSDQIRLARLSEVQTYNRCDPSHKVRRERTIVTFPLILSKSNNRNTMQS